MVYEAAILARSELSDEKLDAIKSIVTTTIASDSNNEVLLEDDWGVHKFAQFTSRGVDRGRYLYYIFRTDQITINKEIDRKLRINEDVLRSMVVCLGENKNQTNYIKDYQSPFRN